jgi:hypothetical protein
MSSHLERDTRRRCPAFVEQPVDADKVWRTLGFARAPHDRRTHELDLVGRGYARPQAEVFL